MSSMKSFTQRALCKGILAFSLSIALFLGPVSITSADTIPPVISHEKNSDTVSEGSDFSISAFVSDNEQIRNDKVILNLKPIEESDYMTRVMEPAGDNEYRYRFGRDELRQPGLDYFITAEDVSGNKQTSGFSFDPYRLQVGPPTTNTNSSSGGLSNGNRKYLYILAGVLAVGLAASMVDTDDDTETTTTFIVEGGQ